MKSVLRYAIFAAFIISALVPAGSVLASGDETITGWLSILWGDAQDGATATQYVLTDETGEQQLLSIEESLAESLGGLLTLNQKQVTLLGQWESASAVEGEPPVFQVTSIRPSRRESAPEVSAAITGSQPWVTIMCKFSDYSAEPKNLAYFQGMYSSSYPGLDHYWREVSYNKANVVGSTAVGWYVLPQPRSYYVYNGQLDFDRAAKDCTRVADPVVNFSGMVGINMMFNAELDGFAWGGTQYLTLDGVSKLWRVTWEPPWGYADITVISHEMGHGFGLPHSSGNYGQTYDNRWDVMSDSWTDCGNSRDLTYGCLGQHTIAYHKDMLGWIPSAEKFKAAGGTATITLEQLAQPQTGNYKIAIIPIGTSSTRFYTVEVRRKAGYDQKLPGTAVIIHEVDTARSRPAYVIDPDGNGDTGDAGAMWAAGETFSDAAKGISVNIVAATATGFTVSITTPGTGPSSFGKIGPANGTTVPLVGLTLAWNASNGASSYEYCYDTINNNTCDDIWRSTDTTFASPIGLSAGRTYFWQVRARNDFGVIESNAGAWWKFKTSLTAPVSLTPGELYPGTAVNIHTRRPTFAWEAVPGAASYTLEVALSSYCSNFASTVLVASTTGTTYTPSITLKANKVYCWRVKAIKTGFNSPPSSVRTFTTGNPPSVPVLSLPASNALITNGLRPRFDWADSTLPAETTFNQYELQLDTVSTFETATIVSTTPGDLSASEWTPDFDLSYATTYYWRVRSWNTNGDFSPWSAARSLRIAYPKPILLTPAAGELVATRKPAFSWTPVAGATSYKLQVSASPNFGTLLVNVTITGTSYTPTTGLTANKLLYWRIQALGKYGPTAWTTTWSFTTP